MLGLVDYSNSIFRTLFILLLEEKRTLGNEMNAPKEDRQDHYRIKMM